MGMIHKKVSQNVIDVLSKGNWTKWGFTDCAAIECPKCGAPKYHYCSTPKGRKAWPPHSERYNALVATGYTANQRPGTVKTVAQFLEVFAEEGQRVKVAMYKSLNDASGLCPSLAPGKTRIWYVKSKYFADATLNSLAVDPQHLDETHVLLGEVVGDHLEILFHDLQGDFWSPNGEAFNLISGKGLGHTSMSIGDIVESSSGVFICAMFGWDKLELKQ